jgi:hypothetical protein
MFELRRRERLLRDSNPTSLDRFVLGLALFSALTLFGTLAMLCTVVGLAGLLIFSNVQLLSSLALNSPQQVISPLAEPSPTPLVESPLPEPTPTPEPVVEPILQPTSELPTPIVEQPLPESPVQPTPELPPQPVPVEPSPTPTISFLNALTAQLVNFNNALNLLNGMLINSQLGNGDWQLQVRLQHDILRQNYNEVLNGSAPPELNDLQIRSISATQQCISAVFTIETAINNADMAMIQQGTGELSNCMPGVQTLLNEIGALQNNTQP